MARVVIPGFRKIEVSGGGEGGTSNYNDLTNKPSINNVPLVGNLRTVDLKLTDATLTEEGVPAEAKTVGAKLEEQASSLTALSEQLGNHTVKSDVPENAVFTDTLYDDTEVKEDVDTLNKETTVNLLKHTLETTSQNGVTCTNNGDGTYTLNGTSTANVFINLGRCSFEKNKTYNILGWGNTNYQRNSIGLYIETSKENVFDENGDGGFYTPDSEESCRIMIVVINNTTIPNAIIKPMITTNLSATYDDFVPYTGSTGKLNSDVASLLKRIEALESIVNKTDTTTVETE